MVNYQILLTSVVDSVCEKNAEYLALTERHIQALWFEQKYFKNLVTSKGQTVQILSPGIWNGESGPDFLKAHLRIGGEELKGDVEIHLQDGEWYQHRHHRDQRYNQVVLHLSLWPSFNSKPIISENGRVIETVYLEPVLTVSLRRLLHLIDLDLYPYRRFVGSGNCAQSLFKKLSEEKITSFFKSAALWRLDQKKQFLEARFDNALFRIPAGIAMALGYKKNTEAFLDLFTFLLDFRDLSADEILAVSLGVSGFFDQHSKAQWEHSIKYLNLKDLWEEKKERACHQSLLQVDHVRPFNHPVRRLVYMSKLLTDPTMEGTGEKMNSCWREKNENFAECRNGLMACIPVYQDRYWNSHYLFEGTEKKQHLVLIGEDLKRTILINSFLPLLQADIKKRGDQIEWERFQAFYASFKVSAESGKNRYLVHRFFGDNPKGKLLRSAQLEQGAYQLHKDFCIHFEASCEGCPFVERYVQAFD